MTIAYGSTPVPGGFIDFTDMFYEVNGVQMSARMPGHRSEERCKMFLVNMRQKCNLVTQTVN